MTNWNELYSVLCLVAICFLLIGMLAGIAITYWWDRDLPEMDEDDPLWFFRYDEEI